MTLGVTANDFVEILADMKRTLSYQVVTKTIDPVTGDERLTYASASNVEMVFFLNDNRFNFDKEGLVEVGDAYVMALPATGIKRYDRFTVDGITYLINNIFQRTVLGVDMCDYGVCFVEN